MALITNRKEIQLTDMEMRAALVKAGVIAENESLSGIIKGEDEERDVVYTILSTAVDTSLKI